MKNIWIFNHYAGPPSVTSGLRHYYFAKHLIDAGYSVTVFAASTVHNSDRNLIEDGRPYREMTENGVPFVFVRADGYQGNGKSRIKNMIQYYRGLFKVTKRFEKPDVIIGSSVHPLACVAAVKLAKKYRCKCIVEIRDLWPESIVVYQGMSRRNPVIAALYRLEKWLYAKADRLIFTMPGGAKYIAEHKMDKEHGGPVDLKKVYSINNGIDRETFEKNRELYTIADKDLDDPATFKVVYTGSVRLANHLEKLIRAAKIVQDSGYADIRFLIYGKGDEKARLEELCRSESINNVFFKGAVDKKYIPYILSKCQIAYSEGKNNPLFEYGSSANKQFDYYAAGIPLVAGVTYWKDILTEYHCGFSTDSDDPQAVADLIIRCRTMPKEEYEQLRQNSKRAAENYDFSNLSRQLIQVVEE